MATWPASAAAGTLMGMAESSLSRAEAPLGYTVRAGRKRNAQREALLGILDDISAESVPDLSANEWLAEVGLVAWQRGVGTFRDGVPASRWDAESFDPQWRKIVVDRVRRLIGPDIKALQTATT
jgi:hypothetical protein